MVLSASLSTDLQLLLTMITWLMVFYLFWKFLTKALLSPPVYKSQGFSYFLSHRRLFLTALFLSGASCTWVKAGYTRKWGIGAFGGSGPCSEVPQQCSEGVLAPPPATRTPPNFCPHRDLNQEPSTFQHRPPQTELPLISIMHQTIMSGWRCGFFFPVLHILWRYKVSFFQMRDTSIVRGLHQTLGHFCWLVHSRWLWRRSADLK